MRIGLLHFAPSDAGASAGAGVDAAAAGALLSATRSLRGTVIVVSPGDARLPRCDAVIVSGARASGRPAEGSPAMRAVVAFATAGGPVLGVGEGFRLLCEAGLLPGSLGVGGPETGEGEGAAEEEREGQDGGGRRATAHVRLRVEGRPTPFTSAIPAGRVMRLGPAAHAGRYHAADVDALEERGQIVFRYCDTGGGVTAAANPHGSLRSIAGICNRRGNVVALVAQPLAGDDGEQLIQSLRLHLGQGE